jgi:hypothetical protein
LAFLEEDTRRVLNEFDSGNSRVVKKNFKWVWMAASLLIISIAGYMFLMDNDPKEAVTFASLYQAPAWPVERGQNNDDLSNAIGIALDGDLNQGISMLKNSDNSQVTKNLWISELFANVGQVDSLLHYLPQTSDDFTTRDRINYLRIIALYHQGKKQEVKQLIDALPPDTDKWYLGVYEKIN